MFAGKPAGTTAGVAAACIRIEDLCQRRAIVVGFLGSAIGKEHKIPDSIFEAGVHAALPVARAAKRRQITGESRLIRVIRRDAINHAADRVAAVEKSGGTFDDFHPVEGKDIDRFNLVGGLRGDSSETHAVLQHQHSITIKAANTRTTRSGTKTAFGNSKLAVKALAD